MSNTDNPGNHREQLATILADYRALLAMTCPLIITEHSLPAWRGGEIGRLGFGISPEPGDWHAESTLRRGEIFRSDEPGLGITENEQVATRTEEAVRRSAAELEDAPMESISAVRRKDSNLRIRVYIGMS